MSPDLLDSERYVLGALLIAPQHLAALDIGPEHFSRGVHTRIFEAMLSADAAGEPVDLVTVKNRLGERDRGELIGVGRDIIGTSGLDGHAKLVREHYRRRQALDIADGLRQRLRSGDPEAIDAAISALMALNASRRNCEWTLNQALMAARDHLDAALNGETDTGIPTGLARLDRTLGGLHRQDLVVVGARPSVGKTAFALGLAIRAGAPVGIFSGEQGYEQLGQRAIAHEGRLSLAQMRNARLAEADWPRVSEAVGKLHNAPIRIYDRPSPTLAEVRNVARAWKHHHGIDLVIVDYLQRMRGDRRLDQAERLGEIVCGLKELARELDIPVVALAQVNRNVETRHDKRPMMADLKGSGDIEQEADQVLLLYRDEVYHPDSEDKGICEVLIDKNRHGPVGVVKVAWLQEWVRFDNLIESAA